MTGRRVGAVSYLNTKPLVYGLERADLPLEVRFDVPSRCAALLRAGQVDVGLIPSIEYLSNEEYRGVPGVAIASQGPVASVALFSKVPVERIARVALDTSSRTSAALTRVLCRERWDIAPAFGPASPDLPAMLREHDAALLIGDPALFTDHDGLGLLKIDIGAEWTAHTGLPFVWAYWVGRESSIDEPLCRALAGARDAGVRAIDAIARVHAGGRPETAGVIARYLRQNITYWINEPHEEALRRFYASAARLGVVPRARPLRFFGRERVDAAR